MRCLAAVVMVLLTATLAQADWLYNFNGGSIPDTFVTEGSLSNDQPSPRFLSSAEGGVLRMRDTFGLPANGGGTSFATGFDPEIFSDTVRVSAEINSTGQSDDWLAVKALVDPNVSAGYWAAFSFQPTDIRGQLSVGKAKFVGQHEIRVASGRVQELARSYFIELHVVDDAVSGYPEITARLLEEEGGLELLEVSFIDNNVGGVPPWTSGHAGVWAMTWGDDALNATFDNIRAVPEPSTLTLLAMAAIGLLAYAWRRRR